MLKHKAHFFAGFFLVVLLVATQYNQWSPYPSGHHSWAQSDRLSLAFGFFLDKQAISSPTLLCSVKSRLVFNCAMELPLQAWISARLGLLFGTSLSGVAYIFRTLDLLVLGLGLFSIFSWVYRSHQSVMWALVAACFAYTMPVVCFFGGNFLPDPFALSLLFIAFNVFDVFTQKRQVIYLVFALLLAMLAAVIKISSAIGLISLLALSIFHFWPADKRKTAFLLLIGAGLLSILVFEVFTIRIQNDEYGCGYFLAESVPLKFPIFPALESIYLAHKGVHFSPFHLWFGLLALLSLFIHFGKPTLPKDRHLLVLMLAGTMGLLWQLGGQMKAHSYYFIVMGAPLLMLIVVLASMKFGSILKSSVMWQWLLPAACIALPLYVMQPGLRTLRGLDGPPNWIDLADKNIAHKIIPENGYLVVLESDYHAPQYGLAAFQKRGFLMKENIDVLNIHALQELDLKDPWFIVCAHKDENPLKQKMAQSKPALHLTLRHSDEVYSIFQILPTPIDSINAQ